MLLKDSVILITGAAARVGRTVALTLARQGAHIAFSYYLPDEPWAQTQADIEACGVQALAVQTEIRDAAQVRRLVSATVEKFGRLDVLINSASVRNWPRISLGVAPTDWRSPISRVRSVTLTSMMFMMPIPPTIREMPATQASRFRKAAVVDSWVAMISCWVVMEKESEARVTL